MDNSGLYLYEVLEGEYEALHDQLPSEYKEFRDSRLADDKKLIDGGQNADEVRDQTNETLVRRLNQLVHRLPEEKKRSALCISGGGIRSATFALGVVQRLAALGLLDKFHYL